MSSVLNLMVYKMFKYFVLPSYWLTVSRNDLENAAYTGVLVVVVNYVFENEEWTMNYNCTCVVGQLSGCFKHLGPVQTI